MAQVFCSPDFGNLDARAASRGARARRSPSGLCSGETLAGKLRPCSCLWSRWDAGKCTQARLDVTAADARGAGAFSTLLLVGSMLVIAAFIVGRKATRAAESEPLLATTA